MDGIDGRQEVYIIAATNRPDIIDKALLRWEHSCETVLEDLFCASHLIALLIRFRLMVLTNEYERVRRRVRTASLVKANLSEEAPGHTLTW